MSQRDGHHGARKEHSYGEYYRQDQRAPQRGAGCDHRGRSANQLGITLASLALGWIGEPAFAGLLKPLFASFGATLWCSTPGAPGT